MDMADDQFLVAAIADQAGLLLRQAAHGFLHLYFYISAGNFKKNTFISNPCTMHCVHFELDQ